MNLARRRRARGVFRFYALIIYRLAREDIHSDAELGKNTTSAAAAMRQLHAEGYVSQGTWDDTEIGNFAKPSKAVGIFNRHF